MWRKAGEIIIKHPFFGVGLGNFPLQIDSTVEYRTSIYAHNTYLDIISETGLLAGIIWITILIYSIKTFIVKSKKDKLFFYFALSLIIFSVHSIFETSLYSPVNLTLFLIIIAATKKYEKVS